MLSHVTMGKLNANLDETMTRDEGEERNPA
jgi:hypothetical protein